MERLCLAQGLTVLLPGPALLEIGCTDLLIAELSLNGKGLGRLFDLIGDFDGVTLSFCGKEGCFPKKFVQAVPAALIFGLL
jgi:hypothetical protein